MYNTLIGQGRRQTRVSQGRKDEREGSRPRLDEARCRSNCGTTSAVVIGEPLTGKTGEKIASFVLF